MRSQWSRTVAVVLAGGYGTRIQHLLPHLPKPMAPVAGRPFLGWVLQYLQLQGLQQVIVSTGYLSEVIEQYLQNNTFGLEVQTCRETEPLGTAGGFLQAARAFVGSPDYWLVLNGDSLVLADLKTVLAPLDPGVEGAIVGLEVPDTSCYGSLVCDSTGQLVQFAEKRSGAGLINAGIYWLSQALLAHFPIAQPLSFEQQVFPSLLEQGVKLKVQPTQAPFLDIGTPASLSQAEAFIRQNLDLNLEQLVVL